MNQVTTEETPLDIASKLIELESVSPEDRGCQTLMAERLEAFGFKCEHLPFDDVSNLWATHGNGGKILAFAGHTDVVPPGPLDGWDTPPFEPVVKDGMLYGRGAADMKGSLAAMLVAARRFTNANPEHEGTLAFLITSDEEAAAINGTRRVMETLEDRGTKIDWCVVGEPSSSEQLGDVVRIGRRGSLNAMLTVKGIQGHVAYPADAVNPIHRLAPALTELVGETWDNGNQHFPATTMQVSNINAGTGAPNVVPGHCTVLFNFRYSTESTAEALQERTEAILTRHGLDYDIKWSLSGKPFLTTGDTLVNAMQGALDAEGLGPTELSTSGGTSDGRFISPYGVEVIELGPINKTIHKLNECVRIDDLETLACVYEGIMTRLLTSSR